MAPFDVEGTWQIEHGSPGAGLVPFRLDGRPTTLEEVGFLADCVSFDHDMPTVVRPKASTRSATSRPIQPVFRYLPAEDETLGYYNEVEAALGAASEIRLGDAHLSLRYPERPTLTKFTTRFASVEAALGLYAMATRQVEILAEYLCLYRVLERAKNDNGVSYVARHLKDLHTHDFGTLWAHRYRARRGRNVFEIYRRRALNRLGELRGRRLSDMGIAEHLYSIRNGLAHGNIGRSKVLFDRAADLPEIGRDLPIVKLLARLVVDKVP